MWSYILNPRFYLSNFLLLCIFPQYLSILLFIYFDRPILSSISKPLLFSLTFKWDLYMIKKSGLGYILIIICGGGLIVRWAELHCISLKFSFFFSVGWSIAVLLSCVNYSNRSALLSFNAAVIVAGSDEHLLQLLVQSFWIFATLHPDYPVCLTSLSSSLQMITKNFEDYPEHRLKFFSLLRAIATHCFPALIRLSSDVRISNACFVDNGTWITFEIFLDLYLNGVQVQLIVHSCVLLVMFSNWNSWWIQSYGLSGTLNEILLKLVSTF